MARKPNSAAAAAHLRRRAEKRLPKRPTNPTTAATAQKADADTQRLFHELQVHHIELEMQNTELQDARTRMEALLEKYTDLYDFAPVGYFSLDGRGTILEVNLTGAALLGWERSRLTHRSLLAFVAPESQPIFVGFVQRVFASPGKQICELALLNKAGKTILADLQATAALSPSNPDRWCRVAVLDITARKRAEEAQHQLEVLAFKNRELKQEIVRRRAEEQALTKSEQQQTRLLEQSKHLQEQLRHLSHRLLQAQEEERKLISRELHDQIVQTLVGIQVHLETLARDVPIDPKELKKKIGQTQRLVEKSVDTVHRFARELRPTLLDDLGLIATLHSFMKDFTKRTGIHVGFTTFAGVEQLDSANRTVLYRVVQSALTNVGQHAQASRVDVSIQKLPGAVHLEIKDNGKSFQVKQVLHAKKNKRLGLIGMRERVEMVGGSFAIDSAPSRGTTIRAQIPFGPTLPLG